LSARANTSVALVGKNLVLGTTDGFLIWIDTDSGAITKRIKLPGFPYGTLISASSQLFALVKGTTAKLISLDPMTGVVGWERETPKEWTTFRPLVTDSVVIVGSEAKDLCAFNQADGAVRWCRDVGQVPRGLGVSGDALYGIALGESTSLNHRKDRHAIALQAFGAEDLLSPRDDPRSPR
jgi:outer membrane protein assembly factor BamB